MRLEEVEIFGDFNVKFVDESIMVVNCGVHDRVIFLQIFHYVFGSKDRSIITSKSF